MRKVKRDLTQGPIIKTLLSLAWPIVLANIFAMTYQLTDTFWVGRLGAEAVAAISLSFPIIFLLVSFAGGLAMAGSIMVAQFKGQKDEKNIKYFSGQVFSLMSIAGILITILGYIFTPYLLGMMKPEAAVFTMGVEYLRWSFLGITLLFIYYVYQALMRGVGEVKIPMFLVLFSVLLNFIMDPLFIFGWEPIPAMGVSGAAIATMATQGLAGLIALVLMFKGTKGINLDLKDLRPRWSAFKKLFKLGVPASIERSMMALSLLALLFLVTDYGTEVLAAYGIGGRITSMLFIPISGLTMASATLVGQNFGAGKKERVEEIIKKVARLVFVLAAAVSSFIFFFAETLATVFVPDNLNVISLTSQFVQISLITLTVLAVKFVFLSSFRAVGDTKASLFINIFSLWLFRLPLAYILSTYTVLAYLGIWFAFPIADLLTFFLSLAWYKWGAWRNKKVVSH